MRMKGRKKENKTIEMSHIYDRNKSNLINIFWLLLYKKMYGFRTNQETMRNKKKRLLRSHEYMNIFEKQ